jgi:tetratricopeptide (TPR) repeat protein
MRMIVGLVLLLSLPAVGVAEEPPELNEAARVARSRAHYERARAHFNLGEYEAAMREFEEGYRYKPNPLFLYNIAQAARKAGRRDKALELFKRYLVVSPRAAERREVERAIAELERERAAHPPEPPPVERKPIETKAESPPVTPVGPAAAPATPAVTPATPAVTPTTPAMTVVAPAAAPVAPRRPWYRDWLAPTLAGAGAALLVAGGADFAVNDGLRSAAGKDYASFERARGTPVLMTVDVVLMGVGGALVAGGALRWGLLARRDRTAR